MSDFWYEMLEGFVFVVCCAIIIAALIVIAP